MGHEERRDANRTHSDPPRTVEDRPDHGRLDYVNRILQYEWADVLVSVPPETPGINWVPGHVGKHWGRVAPDVWSSIRERGFDPYFRHHPTAERFERGVLQFELWFESVSSDGDAARTDVERVVSTARERIDEYVSQTPDIGSWESAEVVVEEPTVVWRTTYQYPSEDEVAYYETLRRAIEDHEWVVELVHDAVEEFDR